MIYTAIEALKEKDGSSKRAISKYIEHVYRDQLPNSESHQNLLTHHLKRLKSEGLLQMIKNSYIIPRSTPLPPSPAPPPPTTASPSSRPRGRPRKAQTPVAQTQSQAQDNNTNFVIQPQPLPVAAVTTDNNNNSSNPAAAQTQAQQNASAEPVWAALGLNDEHVPIQPNTVLEGSKRGRGRPKKGTSLNSPGSTPIQVGLGSISLSTTPSRGRGRPPGSKSKSKKRPGRPPKIQPESLTPASGTGTAGGSKRRPGRPPKNQQQNPTVIPFAAPVQEGTVQAGVEGVAVLTPRSRGRPRKNVNAVAAVPVAAVAATGSGRGRGRGRGGVAGRGRGGGRGRGRPRLNLLAQSFGKRPVGRPKKVNFFNLFDCFGEIDNFVIICVFFLICR